MCVQNAIKASCKDIWNDIWNAFMVKGADFSPNVIPLCPTTAVDRPTNLISYTKAKTYFHKCMQRGDKDFFVDKYVHFYIDDYKFDRKLCSIWNSPYEALKILQHFAGIITPDFSTYDDFPFPLTIYNTYRMRAFGYWYGTLLGNYVINNVRWDTEETFSYCFDGIPKNSVVAIDRLSCQRFA